MNIWELKEVIKNLPDNMEIFYERIEDIYFDKHWWKASHLHNNSIHPEYPHTKDEDKDQYINTFCAFVDDWKLCITAHF